MDLKDTITKWHTGMCLLESESQLEEAVSTLLSIGAPSAKIFHNIGCIRLRQTLHSDAIQCFNSALEKDKYLALTYFQRGFCYHHMQRYDRAELDFLTAQSMCPKDGINYRQLGADFVLRPEFLGECLKITRLSSSQRRHRELPDFNRDSCLFWPPKKMVGNLAKQDFLGKAKIISSTEEKDIIYAADKMPNQSLAQSKAGHTAPSASLRKQVIVTRSGAEIVVPPRPKRPPPTLPVNCGTLPPMGNLKFQFQREKSKSAEDILDGSEEVRCGVNTGLGNSSSGSRLNVRPDLTFGPTHQANGQHSQTFPRSSGHRAAHAELRTPDSQGRSLLIQEKLPRKPPPRPQPCQPQTPTPATVAVPVVPTIPPMISPPGSSGEESSAKKTVRELAQSFSQPVAILSLRAQPASNEALKPAKPARPPPPQRSKH